MIVNYFETKSGLKVPCVPCSPLMLEIYQRLADQLMARRYNPRPYVHIDPPLTAEQKELVGRWVPESLPPFGHIYVGKR